MHNNSSESDIREYVRRRKINGTTRHELGRLSRDTFASIKKTCVKLGIHFWSYLSEHIFKRNLLKPLVDYMYLKANKDTEKLRYALSSF